MEIVQFNPSPALAESLSIEDAVTRQHYRIARPSRQFSRQAVAFFATQDQFGREAFQQRLLKFIRKTIAVQIFPVTRQQETAQQKQSTPNTHLA